MRRQHYQRYSGRSWRYKPRGPRNCSSNTGLQIGRAKLPGWRNTPSPAAVHLAARPCCRAAALRTSGGRLRPLAQRQNVRVPCPRHSGELRRGFAAAVHYVHARFEQHSMTEPSAFGRMLPFTTGRFRPEAVIACLKKIGVVHPFKSPASFCSSRYLWMTSP